MQTNSDLEADCIFSVGNDVVTELCLTFVYRWLLPSKRKAKLRTLPTHYQSVVLVWLILAFLSDFYFKVMRKKKKLIASLVLFQGELAAKCT